VFSFLQGFREAAGLEILPIALRVRLEDARTQLLNPNRHRISEVAYDVGFSPLTQFNRTRLNVCLANRRPVFALSSREDI